MSAEYLQQKPLAYVYLAKENDERNKCLLMPAELVVIYKGRLKRFNLADIRVVSFTTKVLLLPIVAGGAFGPFFFIALLNDQFLPAISLCGFLLSTFLFYYGFAGKQALKIELQNDVNEIFLSKISQNLKSFVEFTNEFIRQDMKIERSFEFYIPISEVEKAKLSKEGTCVLDQNGVFGYTARDFDQKYASDYFKADLREENLQVKFEKDETGKLRPKIYGRIMARDKFGGDNS